MRVREEFAESDCTELHRVSKGDENVSDEFLK